MATAADGDPLGVELGAVLGEAPPVGAGDMDDAGVGVGVGLGGALVNGLGGALGVGVGLGVGGAVTASSPGCVTCSRYPADPDPLLSRWPSGPRTETTSPVTSGCPPCAAAETTRRSGPDPSSTITPRPSARADGVSLIVPETASRRPSSDSVAAPVVMPSASGIGWRPTTSIVDPATLTTLRLKYEPTTPSTAIDEPTARTFAKAASSRSAIPPVASWRNPTRAASRAPRSVVRVPATRTIVPSGCVRASAIDIVSTGAAVGVGTGVRVGVGTASLGMGVGIGDWVGIALGTVVGVAIGVAIGVAVGVGTASLGKGVGIGDWDGPGTTPGSGAGSAARFCGFGIAIEKSARLSFESVPLPRAPPGRRSTLEPAMGAGKVEPSTKAFVASPHATASTGRPPITRRTTAPPVADRPPEYVASAIGA